MRNNIYLELIAVFTPLSLLSLGGGQSIVADISQQAVDIHGWVTPKEFADLFAVSRAAPGPGALLTTLIGWKAAGWLGAITASLALFIPSSLLAYGMATFWGHHRHHPWRKPIEHGLAPVATGLILAGAFSILRSTSSEFSLWGITTLALFVFIKRPKVNPLLVLLSAGLANILIHSSF